MEMNFKQTTLFGSTLWFEIALIPCTHQSLNMFKTCFDKVSLIRLAVHTGGTFNKTPLRLSLTKLPCKVCYQTCLIKCIQNGCRNQHSRKSLGPQRKPPVT